MGCADVIKTSVFIHTPRPCSAVPNVSSTGRAAGPRELGERAAGPGEQQERYQVTYSKSFGTSAQGMGVLEGR